MKPLVLEYLCTHTLRQLEEDHGVKARPNSHFDKFSLNYDQILSKNGDPVSEQCRGMVIRPSAALTAKMLRDEANRGNEPLSSAGWRDRIMGNVELLAWPMNRFYNYGDVSCAPVDWSDPGLRVYEKLDGTMCVVYWDPLHVKWHVATRGVSEADLPITKESMQIGDMTFSELFLKALIETRVAESGTMLEWDVDGPDKVVHLNKELTYVFELTSPFNRVVVKYDESRVALLAARHTDTGREVRIEDVNMQWVNRPQSWKLSEPVALQAFVESSDPSKLEGAVVVDSRFSRVKVKSKAYVLSSRAKDLVTVSRRSALDAILQGKIDDVISIVEKDVADELRKMQDAARRYVLTVDKNFADWKTTSNGSRKDFAAKVLASDDWNAPYFNLWEGRASNASEWIEKNALDGKLSSGTLDFLLKKMGL